MTERKITEWKVSEENPGYLVGRYASEKAIVTVHRPVLNEEERAKRMEQIKQAAVDLLVATEWKKMKENRQQKK